jgi:hypothetical protein
VFDTPVHVYDDTSVPFRGRIFVEGTEDPDKNYDGCPILGAEVCLVDKHARVGDTQGICVFTDYKGEFEAPAVIGSKVSLKVNFHNHAFIPTFDNSWDYDNGIKVDINNRYERHDFMDMTKAQLIVEVAGGLCNHALGTSIVEVKVSGCADWSETYPQDGFKAAIRVPAQVLDVRVVDVLEVISRTKSRTRANIREFFIPDNMIQMVNLLETAMEDDAIKGNSTEGNSTDTEKEEEALQETRETVRFQFDGDLEISLRVLGPSEKGACTTDRSPKDDVTYSLHVMRQASDFTPMLMLKYKVLDSDPPLYCDMLSDDMSVRMINKVGVDDLFEEFAATLKGDQDLIDNLLLCSESCVVDVTHDERTGREATAVLKSPDGETMTFKTGRPNYLPDYKKSFTFEAMEDGVVLRRHIAEFIVTGDYDQGGGPSFALPTYEPVLVLRDPPGGLSTASYTNVQTTISVTTENMKVMAGYNAGLAASVTSTAAVKACAGGGLGAIVLVCNDLLGSKTSGGGGLSGGADFVTKDKTNEYTGKYTTTWSYTTSDDPLHAGRLSDIMVVPNLNVEYHKVWDIQFISDICSVDASETVKFELTSKKNVPTMSFLSVHNIESYQIPELKDSIELLEDEVKAVEAGEVEGDIKDHPTKITALKDALDGWNKALDAHNKTNVLAMNGNLTIAPAHWFDKYAALHDSGDNEPAMKSHYSSLTPERLVNRAKALTYDYIPPKKDGEGDKQDLKSTNRIHFSGGGSTMEFTMNHDQIDGTKQNDPDAAPLDNGVARTKVDLDFKTVIDSFGGIDLAVHGDVTLESTHSKTITDTTESQTSISFKLGDGDREDEFVIDIYIDPTHGTFVFPLVSGRSKGPHEGGDKLERGEIPIIQMVSYPIPPVLPDDEIVVQLRIINKGVSPSGFIAFLDHRHNPRGLHFHLSGESLAVPIGYWLDPGEIFEVFQDLTIKRGPEDFLYESTIMRLTAEWDGYVSLCVVNCVETIDKAYIMYTHFS